MEERSAEGAGPRAIAYTVREGAESSRVEVLLGRAVGRGGFIDLQARLEHPTFGENRVWERTDLALALPLCPGAERNRCDLGIAIPPSLDAQMGALSQWRTLEAGAIEALPEGWGLEKTESGQALVAAVGSDPEPVSLTPPVTGTYAVFATPHAGGCLLQVGQDPVIRSLGSDSAAGETFVCATDLTEASIRVFAFDPWNEPKSGLARLRLVPVTAQSVRTLYAETSTPPAPLYACLLYTSPSPRDRTRARMPSSG